ncbi:hypothetical protein KY290_017608 [Solanum tuberosum]|uniref:Uncharacterized protein n=1 Tax=Solanum tuberosum TaxID=4113 RepID=A0ABQ7VBS5_SOLTU|nr:hypothetical protein KY290_017608 [Solanum tuberosum]
MPEAINHLMTMHREQVYTHGRLVEGKGRGNRSVIEALSIAIGFPTADVIDSRDFFANKSGDRFGKEIQTTANVVSSLGVAYVVVWGGGTGWTTSKGGRPVAVAAMIVAQLLPM